MAVEKTAATTKRQRISGWLKGSYATLLFSAAILGVALVVYLFVGGPLGEARYIQKDRYQAVLINMNNQQGNQFYFGKLTDVNSRFLRLRDIFYIQSTPTTDSNGKSSTQNTLKKLGCEVHGPLDEMVINRDQVIFWENVRDDGQVVTKIEEFKKQNPDGQKCTTANSSNSTSSTTDSTTTTTPTQ